MRRSAAFAVFTAFAVLTASLAAGEARLSQVADLGDQQATGVAVNATGRTFVCFPRWRDGDLPQSVAEIVADGRLRPFPDAAWNAWQPGSAPDNAFVCVQSVFADQAGSLWILDPASPRMKGVVGGGAKLVRVDLADDQVHDVFRFDETIAPPRSYLNDVRVTPDGRFAFITDSGLGAIVVVDVARHRARRLLGGHPSTQAEGDRELTIDGRPLRENGQTPRVHADGIALSPDGRWLYWHALTADGLYRIPLALLTDPERSMAAVEGAVERVAPTGACDGMAFGPDGWLYLTQIEASAIARFDPADHTLATVIRDPRLSWPDSLAFAPDGSLLVTASRIEDMPRFNAGQDRRRDAYRLWRVELPH